MLEVFLWYIIPMIITLATFTIHIITEGECGLGTILLVILLALTPVANLIMSTLLIVIISVYLLDFLNDKYNIKIK